MFVAKSKHLLERYLVKVFCSIYVIAKKRKIILFYSYNKQRAIDHEGWAVGVAALWGGVSLQMLGLRTALYHDNHTVVFVVNSL